MKSIKIFSSVVLILAFCFTACSASEANLDNLRPPAKPAQTAELPVKIKNDAKIIHVLVALCDNVNQGIVPVPAHLGNGDDTAKNLYWGAAFGVKAFFGKSKSWVNIFEAANPKENVLERVVFKHKTQNAYLIADAYRGSKMRETIDDFFAAGSGAKRENVDIKQPDKTLQILGGANMVAFVGHDGLMDFKLETEPSKADEDVRDAIILACASKPYFSPYLKKTGANPLLWTSNLMAPEAYTLHDAIEGWLKGETGQQINLRAAQAYAKYQKISVKAAQGLFVTGW